MPENAIKAVEQLVIEGATPAEVFDFLADTRNEALWHPQLKSAEKLSEGPQQMAAVLVRWRQRHETHAS